MFVIALGALFCLMALSLASSRPGATQQEAGKAPGDPAKGKLLFLKNCSECHGDRGEGRKKEEAPTIGGNDFLITATDRFLTNAILRGRPGTKMNGFEGRLGEEEVRNLVAFLRSLQKARSLDLGDKPMAGGNPARGKGLFEANCVECHGDKGEGKKGPALNNKAFLDDAPDMFLYRTIAQGRKGTPMDPMLRDYGGRLSQKDILDLITFIRQWGSYDAANTQRVGGPAH